MHFVSNFNETWMKTFILRKPTCVHKSTKSNQPNEESGKKQCVINVSDYSTYQTNCSMLTKFGTSVPFANQTIQHKHVCQCSQYQTKKLRTSD